MDKGFPQGGEGNLSRIRQDIELQARNAEVAQLTVRLQATRSGGTSARNGPASRQQARFCASKAQSSSPAFPQPQNSLLVQVCRQHQLPRRFHLPPLHHLHQHNLHQSQSRSHQDQSHTSQAHSPSWIARLRFSSLL